MSDSTGEFIVHSIPGSPFGRAVLATLIAKGANWRLSAVMPGMLKDPVHLARHPFGRIPVIDHVLPGHEPFRLYETQAILRYVDRILPEPALTPADPRAAARMDQAIGITDWYLFREVASVIGFQRLVGPRLLGLETDLAAIAAVMPAAHRVMTVLDGLVADQPWLAGQDLSLADFAAFPHVDFLAMTPEWAELSTGREALVAWHTRMSAHPAMVATTWERVAALA